MTAVIATIFARVASRSATLKPIYLRSRRKVLAHRARFCTVPLCPSPFARTYRTTGFIELDHSLLIEEEELPFLKAEEFYPVRLERFATVWLLQNLGDEAHYMTLKICVKGQQARNEVDISQYLQQGDIEHPGKPRIRTAWDLLESHHLFFARKDGLLNDEQHLAEMTSLPGPPPAAFLQRSEQCKKYWDDHGNWIGQVPLSEQTFEMRLMQLDGEPGALFCGFMRNAMRWLLEERPVAGELAVDDSLMERVAKAQNAK